MVEHNACGRIRWFLATAISAVLAIVNRTRSLHYLRFPRVAFAAPFKMRQQDFQATQHALVSPKNSLPYPAAAEINLEKNLQISAIHDPPAKRTVGCAVGRSLPLVQCGPARTSRCVEAASFNQLLHASESTERDSCCWRPWLAECSLSRYTM